MDGILRRLVTGISVNRGHIASLYATEVVQYLRDRREDIGRA